MTPHVKRGDLTMRSPRTHGLPVLKRVRAKHFHQPICPCLYEIARLGQLQRQRSINDI
ncbi:hypothetical protein GCM10023317_65280 [Actinopolymorpha pittospori]